MEERVWEFVRDLLRRPERIKAGLDRLIEEEDSALQGDPEREAELWSRKMAEAERRGYLRLAARGT